MLQPDNSTSGIKSYLTTLFHHHTIVHEHGEVIALRPNRIAIVACAKQDSCNGCAAAGGCRSDGGSRQHIYADNVPYARMGDQVSLRVETSAGIADSQTFLYIIAIIMLALGLGVGYFIATLLPTGISAAVLALIIGAAFMVGGVAVVRYGRRAVVQSSLAQITEIITPAENNGSKR